MAVYNKQTDYHISAFGCSACQREFRTMVLIKLGSSDHSAFLCMEDARKFLELLPQERIFLRTCDHCGKQVEEIGCVDVPVPQRRKVGHIYQETITLIGGERDGEEMSLSDDGQLWCLKCIQELLAHGEHVYDSMTMDED